MSRKRRFNIRKPIFILMVAALIVLVYKSVIHSAAGNSYSLYSQHAILIRLDDQTMLMEKKSREKIYPASLTKMMTVITAIEKLQSLQEEVLLRDSIFSKLVVAGASTAGFEPGEQVRAIDLLYGAMLPSGAECCIGLAEKIAGSEKDFVKMMNLKAAQMGLEDTHFTNSTGLHDENHYSTVKDMSILLCEALKNKTFRKIFTASTYCTSPTNKHPDGITFYSTMFNELNKSGTPKNKILGGKTGYTQAAGLCLASLAEVDGDEYVLVTAEAQGSHESEQYNITDAFTVYNRLEDRFSFIMP